MGSSSQAIRYPVATTDAGNIDALNRVLADLCTISNPKDGAALTLRRLVEEEARDLSGEGFARFMDQRYELITTFLDSNEVSENLGALRAIGELIDVTISENASKVAKFSNYMSAAFETKHDPKILVLASKVLGHLDRSGGSMTADEVERQVKVALEWLRGERIEYRRFAAVLILKVALRDPTLVVLEKSIEALRACLHVIEKRETRYYRMFEATQDGLGRNAPVHIIHGSLLAVGVLLRNTGEFMMSRYREVAKIVLGYLEHQNRLVHLSITSLLPQIAHFLCDQFVTNYLTICMNHILHVLKIPAECASGFIALGEIDGALDGELTNYLSTITSHLCDAIALRRGRPLLEALACVGNIAKAMGPTMEPHVRGLLDSMFSSGLSLTLVEALEQITESIPPLLPTIQNRLLKCISAILSRSHHSMPRQSASVSRGHITTVTPQVPELSGSALVQLALRTLAHFNFKGHDLLVFARESVVVYLEDEDEATRKDAALCCCKLVANSFSVISSTQFSLSRINCASGKRRLQLVEEV
ncbi:Serine/threonine-protein kinase TOR [Capsicum baccatum]|uniref:Serine/threonine-protein kinase TOR n=1 Tax=Capsicum baccatum TaxID=33114 RepID=A0A2G2V3Z3_CAPBA|nr:Serine/threonine-protein kinase TOR [Capsicum baccatum]